jgi:mono/diheme cytochrome c family protein
MKFLPVCAVLLALCAGPVFGDGKAVYDAKCKACHKADGSGIAAMKMKPLGSAEVQAKSDADLKNEIANGVGKMKPIKLSDADADSVVAYIRTLKK